MVNLEYRNAYSEVLEILKSISEEDFAKIPKDLIKLFNNNANEDYIFVYNPNKTLQEQDVSTKAKYIIAILFRDYWATEKQKEKIIAKEKYDLNKIEEEKKQKYNYDNIFNNEKNTNTNTNNINESLIEVKEESLWDKIKTILLGIIGK